MNEYLCILLLLQGYYSINVLGEGDSEKGEGGVFNLASNPICCSRDARRRERETRTFTFNSRVSTEWTEMKKNAQKGATGKVFEMRFSTLRGVFSLLLLLLHRHLFINVLNYPSLPRSGLD